MARPKIVQFIMIYGILFICGCAASLQLYEGPARPPSELVIIIGKLPHLNSLNILVNGKWVHDVTYSNILPGSYDVSISGNVYGKRGTRAS